jgi:hypothetical protein
MIGPERGITGLLTWGQPHPGYAQARVTQGGVTVGRGGQLALVTTYLLGWATRF